MPNSISSNYAEINIQQIADNIRQWCCELGFQAVGFTRAEVPAVDMERFQAWLDKGFNGGLDYMARNVDLRANPALLHPGAIRIISVRMDYLPENTSAVRILGEPEKAYISRYALGRDYHKLIRKRLTRLGQQIEEAVGDHGYRAFVDSAPVMERPLAQQAGLGWVGKHSLVINRQAGSFFFLGELFTNLPLPVDEPYQEDHCGKCSACMKRCPTNAIVAPYQVDARRCISFLTIENSGSIPEEFRPLMGNRVFGCDDCQLICPWNRFAQHTGETDFQPRHQLDSSDLANLFLWTEDEFLERTAGSAIRRAGFECWLRNLAVGLGNAPTSDKVLSALNSRSGHPSGMVREHVQWALQQHPHSRESEPKRWPVAY